MSQTIQCYSFGIHLLGDAFIIAIQEKVTAKHLLKHLKEKKKPLWKADVG